MGHTSKNGSQLEKWVKIGENGSRLVKFVTLVKVGHIWKNGSKLVKCATLS